MKIVQLTPYYPPCKGGIARAVGGWSKYIGTTEDLCVISQKGEPSEGVSILDLGKGRFITKSLGLLRKFDPEVVHCHSHWHILAPAVVHKRLCKRTRIVFTFHTEPPSPIRGVKRKVFESLLSKCDAITYVSKALKDRINREVTIKTRQRVVYPGVEAEVVREKELEDFAKKFGVKGRFPLLSFVGLLEWKKKVQGIKILLRAVAAIQKRFPSLKLMIVGDGSRREEVEATISDLNLSDSVTITGLVDNVFIPLSLCDIYVHISLQEGLPHSILEAMMSGKPVIASNTGGIPEAVVDGQNGILVEPEEEAIASAILSLLQDPADMVRFGKNGREFVSSRFSWKEAATRLLELYSSS